MNEDHDISVDVDSGSRTSASIQSQPDEHGFTHGGKVASCAIESGGLVDCRCCLNHASSEFVASFPDYQDKATIHLILETIIAAGSNGLTRRELTVCVCFA